MKHAKTLILTCLLALAFGALSVAPASADQKFDKVEVNLSDSSGNAYEPGEAYRAAGGHPDMSVYFAFEAGMSVPGRFGLQEGPVEDIRTLDFALPPGMTGNPTIGPRCSSDDLVAPGVGEARCPVDTQVGTVVVTAVANGTSNHYLIGLYNLVPGAGEPARLGFNYVNVVSTIVAHVRPGDYGISSGSLRVSNAEALQGIRVTLWGVPADPIHDAERRSAYVFPPQTSSQPLLPFLTSPTSCTDTPAAFTALADSWQNPGKFDAATVTADPDGTPFVFDGCEQLPFGPKIEANTLSHATESPTGLDVDLTVPQTDTASGRTTAHVRKVKLTLPQGMSVSPSAAAGQGACDLTQIGYEGRTNEQQALTYDRSRTVSFTVSHGGASTAPIPAQAGAGAVQAAIETLPGLAGNITLSGNPGNWIVAFSGALAATDVAPLGGEVTESPIQKVEVTGKEGGFNLQLGSDGSDGSFKASFTKEVESQPNFTIDYKGPSWPLTVGTPIAGPGIAAGTTITSVLGGSLTISKQPTANQSEVTLKAELPFNASAMILREALRQIPAFGEGEVFAGPTDGDTRGYEVVFNSEAPGAEPTLLTQTNTLSGPGAGVTIAKAPGATSDLAVATVTQAGAPTFNGNAPSCPDSSILGTVQVDTPLLDDPLDGQVILAKQNENPFGSLLALYMVVKGPGFYLKLPGRVDLNGATGQLTTTFDNAPQQPFESVHLSLRGGPRAALVTPSACGTYQAQAEFLSWATNKAVTQNIPMTFDQGCGARGFNPGLSAGSASPKAGAYTPFTLALTRKDGEQNIARIQATLPEGVLAKLAGVALCAEAAAASGNCPAASQVGTTVVAAGPGSNPIYVPEAGKAPTAVYLGGPYKGAPYSLVVKVPAQAGPFDLGNVVVRNALNVNPVTTEVTATSDPLPQILQGIPVSYRDIRVQVTRNEFTLNPTSCDPMSVDSTLTSAQGAVAHPSSHFQVTNCAGLGFEPRLSLKVSGGTKRGQFPALKAVLKAKKGQANIGRAAVTLPHSEFLAQSHINTVCTRVQFAANSCPKGSIYGFARATTPLLDQPLSGPVYLRSSSNPLPDLVADLHGAIDVELSGRIDSINGGIRTTFDKVPDAPVSKFVLTMKGGKKGLLENSANLCARANRTKVLLDGQNAKTADQRPLVRNSCGKKANKK